MNLENEFNNFISKEYKEAVLNAAEEAEYAGIKAYLIGGIARDLILKTPVKDIDITIESDAVHFCRQLEKSRNWKILSIQDNLRTVKAEYKSGAVIDFASSREEYYSASGVMPAALNFGCSLIKDVKRRDFTINTLAIALNGAEKFSLADYTGGCSDLKNKKIRVLHEKSFSDDPSRIVRAVKFQMRLGFDIEDYTAALMEKYLEAPDETIPLDRIKNELMQYFKIEKDGIYENLIKKKVYKLVSSNPVLNFDKIGLEKMRPYFNNDNLNFIYTALLLVNSDFRLNLTAAEKNTILAVKELLHLFPLDINDKLSVYKSFIKKPELSPVIYYLITHDEAVLKFYKELKKIKLLINGNDLINLGIPPSNAFSIIFDKILQAKLEGKVNTKEEELLLAEKTAEKLK